MSHIRLDLKPDAVVFSAAAAPAPRWRALLRRVVATLDLWRHRRSMRRDLQQLDPRTLADIGIAPGSVEYEMRQPFWRPIREWRD